MLRRIYIIQWCSYCVGKSEAKEFEKRYFIFINKVGLVAVVFMLILTIITAILAVVYTLQNHPDSINALFGLDFLFNLTLPVIIIPTVGFIVWLVLLIKKLLARINP